MLSNCMRAWQQPLGSVQQAQAQESAGLLCMARFSESYGQQKLHPGTILVKSGVRILQRHVPLYSGLSPRSSGQHQDRTCCHHSVWVSHVVVSGCAPQQPAPPRLSCAMKAAGARPCPRCHGFGGRDEPVQARRRPATTAAQTAAGTASSRWQRGVLVVRWRRGVLLAVQPGAHRMRWGLLRRQVRQRRGGAGPVAADVSCTWRHTLSVCTHHKSHAA